MSTAMSTKRSFVSSRSAASPSTGSRAVSYSLYALVAGVLMLVIGAQASVDILMIAGFFFAMSAGLALNTLFWAGYYEKNGGPEFKMPTEFYE